MPAFSGRPDEQHHDDGDADQQRQQRDAVPMSEERDQNESDGEESERWPQADADQPVIAEIADSVREPGAHARRTLRRIGGRVAPLGALLWLLELHLTRSLYAGRCRQLPFAQSSRECLRKP